MIVTASEADRGLAKPHECRLPGAHTTSSFEVRLSSSAATTVKPTVRPIGSRSNDAAEFIGECRLTRDDDECESADTPSESSRDCASSRDNGGNRLGGIAATTAPMVPQQTHRSGATIDGP
jgi:hypothetical protein